jgi:hypothetical protein
MYSLGKTLLKIKNILGTHAAPQQMLLFLWLDVATLESYSRQHCYIDLE